MSWVEQTLATHAPDIHSLIDAPVYVGLPDKLTPTSIDIDNKHIRLTLVRRRAWSEHDPEYDKSGKTDDGEPIEFRAFVNRAIRNFIAFEWDLVTNTAVLRISQLQGGMKYENVRKEFDALVALWLKMDEFSTLDLHVAIVKLLEMERNGNGITRTHGFDIHSLLGRSIAATSNASDLSVFGEKSVDDVFDSISTSGTGNHGNFYWLPAKGNPLNEEIRIVLVGSKSRVNFTSPSSEKVIRHVLSEIRKHC